MAAQMPQPKFKVIKVLGKGSYGTVYKVQRLEDGCVYAMKETDLGRMGAKERSDAVNEIRVLGSMSHPNVVRHHETFVSGNKLCIVMEYAPAGDLSSFLKAAAASRLPLPEATVWQILLQLCQGMQAIHETCVIHRDIKPANIFMCPDNVVKIGDLGVAKALTKASHAQTVIGTPLYMAPEVWRGLKYSYSSDLWSLGGVLYEMMAHRLPFDARSLNELKNKIIMSPFMPLVPGAPYSHALVAVAHALLSKDPRKRPTCAAILNSREAAPWLHTIPEAVRLPLPPLDAGPGVGGPSAFAAVGGGAANPQLLPTIQVPRDIRLLPHRLPKPSYGHNGAAQQQQPGAGAVPAVAAAAGGAGVPAGGAMMMMMVMPPRGPSGAAPPMMGQVVAGRHGVPAAGVAAGVAGGRPVSAARAGAAGGTAAAAAGLRAHQAGVPSAVPFMMQQHPSPRGGVALGAGGAAVLQQQQQRAPSPAGGGFAGYGAGAAGGMRPPGAFRAASPSGGINNNAAKVAAGVRVPSAGRVAAAGAPAGVGAGAARGVLGGAGAAAYGYRPAGKPSQVPSQARPGGGGWPY